jgi:hypothetical protein
MHLKGAAAAWSRRIERSWQVTCLQHSRVQWCARGFERHWVSRHSACSCTGVHNARVHDMHLHEQICKLH